MNREIRPMMTLESIQKKIKSAGDLKDIVRTMKTLAAVNIRHYEQAVASVEGYYRTVELGLQVVLRKGNVDLFTRQAEEDHSVLAVIVGSDQGLCGGFNDQITSFALSNLYGEGFHGSKRHLVCTGTRVMAGIEEKGHEVGECLPMPGSLPEVGSLVQRIVFKIEERIDHGEIGQVIVYYNKPLSSVSYKPHRIDVLPIDREWLDRIREKAWPTHMLPSYSMDRGRLFSRFIREYVFISFYRAFIESMSSENAARLASMQAAEKNIEERLDDLTTRFRHRRQSSITSELLDIISGFEALRQSER